MRILAPLAPFAVGGAFIFALLWAILASAFTPGGMSMPEQTAVRMFHEDPKALSLASDGPFGKYDDQQLQRGFQVYKEVCSACHSLRLVSFADLEGIGYDKAQIKVIAKTWPVQQPTISPKGDAVVRPNIASDKFPSPFANEAAARAANNNALPPDFSLITKAREGGAPYVYSLVTGYRDVPAEQLKKFPDSAVPKNLYYNPYFTNLNIAMPPPLRLDGQVSYAPGNPPATKEQMAKDVAAFLTWTAEPKLEARHSAGLATMIFLLIFSVLCYLSYKSVWADKEH